MDHAWGYVTDTRNREENQDCFGVFDFGGITLALVCDGMGGHVGGKEAAGLAIRRIHEAFGSSRGEALPTALETAIHHANAAIYSVARQNRRFKGMGTTVVAAALQENRVHIAHVGDSRVYLIRGGEVIQLTRDHTMVNLFVDAELLSPEEAASHPDAHVLARSLGVERQVEVDHCEPFELRPDDTVLLCTDGVHGVVGEDQFATIDWTSPTRGCRTLMERVARANGDDNATLVVLRLKEESIDSLEVTEIPPEPAWATPTPLPPRIREHLPSSTPEPTPVDEAPAAAPAPPMMVEPERPLPKGAHITVHPDTELPKPKIPSRSSNTTRKTARTVLAFGLFTLTAILLGFGGSLVMIRRDLRSSPPQSADLTGRNPSTSAAGTVVTERRASSARAHLTDGPQPVFAPFFPPAQPTPPHRAKTFIAPPPGGTRQHDAVTAARADRCVDALHTLQTAVSRSVDHAGLYPLVWDCFTRVHSVPLQDTTATTYQDFLALRPHLGEAAVLPPSDLDAPQDGVAEDEEEEEGTAGQASSRQGPPPELPRWVRPSDGGLELRLLGLSDPEDPHLFVAAMLDHRGKEALVEELIRDLIMVTDAAVGLSHLPEPTPEALDDWAHYVYVSLVAYQGRPGIWIRETRPDGAKQLDELLDDATRGAWRTPGALDDLPEVVAQAVRVALGQEPVPEAVPEVPEPPPRRAPVVRKKEEPSEPEVLIPTIHRHGP